MESVDEGNRAPKKLKLCSNLGNASDDERDPTPIDRISNLPQSILCHILSFLPTKSVVATGFLSRSWRYHWTKVTDFDFSYRLWRNSSGDDDHDGVLEMRFINFLNMAFLNQGAQVSMNRFRLQLSDSKFGYICLPTWVTAATARNLRVLDLEYCNYSEFGDDKYMFQLPAALCTCRTLEVLKLNGWGICVKVNHVVFLPKLADLELKDVRYGSEECFGNLVSGCPLLQSLKIRRYYNDNMLVCRISSTVLKRLEYVREECINQCRVEIDTPALEYLLIKQVRESMEVVSVHRLTCLNEVDVDIQPTMQKLTLRLIQEFGCVKVLKLSSHTMENLIEASNKLSAISFERLTKLVMRIDCSKQLSYLMDLIAGCPKLEVLSIKHECNARIRSRRWSDPITVPTCLLTSLTDIYYRGFQGLEDDEMAMFRFISNHASVMKRVVIVQPCKWAYHLREEISQVKNMFVSFKACPDFKFFFEK